MTSFRLSLKAVAITFAIAALVALAIGLGRPQPIENAVLGAAWQCSQTAFIITTCAPRVQQQATPAGVTSPKGAVKATRG
jgi:hypothetical protein